MQIRKSQILGSTSQQARSAIPEDWENMIFRGIKLLQSGCPLLNKCYKTHRETRKFSPNTREKKYDGNHLKETQIR
jgi:hypothetical protein